MAEPVRPDPTSELARPTLLPGVRLQFDTTRDIWVLLSPERVIELEGTAGEILCRCDGTREVAQIIDELAAVYDADRTEIRGDVNELLAELAAKRLIRNTA